MRSRIFSRATRGSVLAVLAVTAGGCSTGSEAPFQTSSISGRPETGMSHEPRRPEPPATYSGPALSSPPSYAQAGAPANSNSYDADRWRNPQPSYAAQPSYQQRYQPSYQPQYSQQQAYQPQQPYQPSYQSQGSYQPQSYQPQPYQPRWQPGPQARAYGTPITTGSLGPSKKSQTVVVRQGDTLYSLSRRHGVPVAELVTANRISDGKIKVGQMLVIPAQTR
jgi:LysM repeat protein